MNIGEWLSTKRAGMPTWVWATAGVAVLSFAFLYYRQKKAGASTAALNTSNGAGTTASIPTGGAAYPMPYSGGDVFVNTPPPNAQSQVNIPSAITALVQGNYVVKGTKSANGTTDNWPGGAAQIIYGFPADDVTDTSIDAMEIMLANPGKITPWPVGTVLSYPLNPQKLATPAPQTTSYLSVGTTSPTGANNSASGQ